MVSGNSEAHTVDGTHIMTSATSTHTHPRLAPRPGEDLMAWLDRNAVHLLKEMVAVGLDESAADSIRFDALRWLLSRAMPKE
jgi:hypothetical protein